jgi:hypothetical protein
MIRPGPFALACLLCLLLPSCHAGEQAAATATEGTPAAASPVLMQAPAMPAPRAAHSATRLPDGRVLLAGGCSADGCEEGIAGDAILFDPGSGRFLAAGELVQARVGHRAVALADGTVLLLGGWTHDGPTALVERYTPASGRFEPHGRLLESRDGFSATLLADGGILVVGGYADGMRRLASAERYDPATGRSTPLGAMASPRMSHTATRLADGRVLVAGGSRSGREVLDTLELFDPASGTFAPAGRLATARHKHAAIAQGERVLLLGGAAIPEEDGHFRDSEWWSPDGVSAGPSMAHGRYKFLDSVTTLPDGRSLVAGGGAQAELLDAEGTAFHPVTGRIGAALAFASATLLADGRVLVAGGYDSDIRINSQAWLLVSAMPAPQTPNTPD